MFIKLTHFQGEICCLLTYLIVHCAADVQQTYGLIVQCELDVRCFNGFLAFMKPLELTQIKHYIQTHLVTLYYLQN